MDKCLVEAHRQHQIALEHHRRGRTERASADELIEVWDAVEFARQTIIDRMVGLFAEGLDF